MGSYTSRSPRSRSSRRFPYGDQNTPPRSAANLGFQNTPSNTRPATLSTFQPTNQPTVSTNEPTVSPSSVNLTPSPESMEEIQNLPEAPSIPKSSRRLPKRPAPPTPAHMLAHSISGPPAPSTSSGPPSLAEMEQIYEQARTNPYGHESMTVTADVNAMTVTAEVHPTHD